MFLRPLNLLLGDSELPAIRDMEAHLPRDVRDYCSTLGQVSNAVQEQKGMDSLLPLCL
jgi:hypothetical protein